MHWSIISMFPCPRLFLPTITGLDHEVDVYAPDSPGSFPILYNMGGLGAIFPGDLYGEVFNQ